MKKDIYFFDLDGTLWDMESEIWIIDKEKPYQPVIKIPSLEFSLIKNGIYKNDNISLDYNGNKFFISKKMWDKIYKKKKSENTQRFGISFKNSKTKEDINKSKINFLLDNISHLKKDSKIGILTARPNLKIHSDVVNKLRLELENLGLLLYKIYFVGDKFMHYHDDKSSLKKIYILLEHLIGFKIKNDRFVSLRQDWFDTVYFYDDAKLNIDYANDIQNILNNLLKNTDDELFKIIIDRIKLNNIYLYNNLITNNIINKFDTTKIKIEEPHKYPIQEKIISNFYNFIKEIK
jgi:transcriptional regulator